MFKSFVPVLIIFFSTFLSSFGQSSANSSQTGFTQLASLPWQVGDGLPYFQDFSGAYGVATYTKIDEQHYAFLSKVKQQILVFDLPDQRKIKTIDLPFSPVDFTFHQGRFYVAGTQYLWEFDQEGRFLTKSFFGDDLLFVDEIKVAGNKVYLIASNQQSYELTARNTFVPHIGVVLKEGEFGKIVKKDAFHFQLMLNKLSRESLLLHFTENRRLGTVKLLGMGEGMIYIELQFIENEQPLAVERVIRAYSVKNEKAEKVFEMPMPDLQYTYLKHDTRFFKGKFNVLISSPEGASLFALHRSTQLKNSAVLRLPERFYQASYHYNRHLPAIKEKEYPHDKSISQQSITRAEIIKNARPYATHQWYCHDYNIKNYDCGGVHVVTPSWVKVGNNVSVPYMWGGFSSIPAFDQGIVNGVSAGDSYTHGNGSGSSCAVGVDCSGFVSQVWDLPYKYSTASLPQISTAYASYDQLLPGDIVNYPHHHVRLIHTNNGNGSFLIIEASGSGTDWRVGYNNYTTADLQGNYIPRHYNYITNVPRDTESPLTSVQVYNWQSADFQVGFSDQDNRSLNEKFYHLCYFDGKRWTSDPQKGFFHDDFTNGLDTSWHSQSGHWQVLQGQLIQSDEGLSNPNIFTRYKQDSGLIYLLQWRMKIGGSGDNRRAGLYFMCDDPTQSQRNDAYMVYFRVDDDRCQIYKATGNSIDLKTSDFCRVDADVWFDAKVVFNPQSGEMRVYKNDEMVSSWIDATPLTSGNSLSLRTGNARVAYDAFKVFHSRGDTARVGVGKTKAVPVQNTSPSQAVCLIYSLVSDSADNLSLADSAFVNIDTTAPSAFVVMDGLGSDLDTAYTENQLAASWTASADSNSGIASYFYAIGSHPFGNDVADWQENQTSTSFDRNDLQLHSDSTYFVSVYAENLAGLVSDTMVSDGVLVLKPNAVGLQKSMTVKLYPMPANQYLNVLAPRKLNQMEVFDLKGKKLNVGISHRVEEKWKINTHTLKNGVYLIFFETDGQRYSAKFMVSH
jgi:hypothetical protein